MTQPIHNTGDGSGERDGVACVGSHRFPFLAHYYTAPCSEGARLANPQGARGNDVSDFIHSGPFAHKGARNHA